MVDHETSVIVIHSSSLQAELWKVALQSQNILAILESPEVSLHEITEILGRCDKTVPTLLLVDLGLKNLNAYALCRWCKENRPEQKIVLTSEQYHKMNSSPVRQWAIEQGAQELLPKFDLASLTSSTLMCLDRVLGILNQQIPDKDALITDLIAYCKTIRAFAGSESPQLKLSAAPASSVIHEQRQGSPTLSLRKINESIPEISEEIFLDFQEPNAVPREQFIPSDTLPSQPVVSQDRYLLWGEAPKWFFILLGIALLGIFGGVVGYLTIQNMANRIPQQDVNKSATPETTVQRGVNLPNGLFSYGGSTTWAILRERVWPKLQAINPQFQLKYIAPLKGSPGSNTGIRMLLDGEIDLSLSSRPLKAEEYSEAKQRGFSLVQYPFAIDGIAVIVHPTLRLPGLTLHQLQRIYRGEITNWKELGGANRSIIALSRPPEDSGGVNYFQDMVLQGQPFGADVRYLNSTTEAIRALKDMPGGIYFGSVPSVITQCQVETIAIGKSSQSLTLPYQQKAQNLPSHCQNQTLQINTQALEDGSYPLTHKLYMVVKHDNTSTEQAGEAFTRLLLTDQGQEAIAQAGFLRIR
jgi:phosphate transport system substrate-binding protein